MGWFDGKDGGSIEQRKYRLKQMDDLCPSAKQYDLAKMSPSVFGIIEENLLKEAQNNAYNSGRIFSSTYRDDGGRKITTYEGDPDAWLKHHKSPGMICTINKEPGAYEETVKLMPGQRVQIVNR